MGIETEAVFAHHYTPATLDGLKDQLAQRLDAAPFYDAYRGLLAAFEMDAALTVFEQSRNDPWTWHTSRDSALSHLDPGHVVEIWQNEQDSLYLRGPCQFRLRIMPHCVIEPGPRWRNFLTDPPIQHIFRDHWSRLAAALGSPGAVYLPDSSYPISAASDMIYDGCSWDEFAARLHTTYGPPATTLGQVMTDYDGNHWFCDTFSKVESLQ